MGFWNDGVRSRSRSRSRSPSKRRATSTRSHSHDVYSRPSAARSASSFLESVTGYSTASRAHTPRRADSYSKDRGIFGFGSSSKRSTYGSSSRARPRDGLVAKIRKWLRDLYYYMRKHPVKVFFLVIMPLITGGALTKILSTVGIRLPPSLQKFVGSNMNRGYAQSERYYSRGGARDFDGGTNLPGMGPGMGGLGESAMGLMNMAKMFI